MRTLPYIALLSMYVAMAGSLAMAEPPAGSNLPLEENSCVKCHGESDLWEVEQRRLFIPVENLADDVHFVKGVNCHDCHGGDPASTDVPEAHATAADPQKPQVRPFRPLSLDKGRTPTLLENQIRFCGDCHPQSLDTYKKSVHGHGLLRSGLLVTAVCSDCHDAHGIYPAKNEKSTLHPSRVAVTCGRCHQLIEQRLSKSVHGSTAAAATTAAATTAAATTAPATAAAAKTSVAEKPKRKPTCTDCHQGHDLANPASIESRLAMPNRCGKCHTGLTTGYAISMHGELTELGYAPAANCSDCHGAHDILPASDSNSTLSSANRLATCKKCHPGATSNFVKFDPHADHRAPGKDPILHWVYLTLMTLLFSTFGFFGVHSLLWFVRSLIDVGRHGRPRPLVPGEIAYVRFGPFHRMAHTVMILSFLGLALTGLPLKYSHSDWAHVVANLFGGFASTGVAHRAFGVVNVGCLVVYVFMLLGRFVRGPQQGGSRLRMVFGPDSPVPTLRDVKDFLRMVRWFFCLGPKPTFERWAYWEKVDFWGAAADIVIIGATGVMLWFPNLVCAYLPGRVLNIAKVVHSTQALLATGFVFAIHFFATHLRPEKFPMDMSILTGCVSEEEFHEERPEYFQRLRESGKLDRLRTTVPPRSLFSLSIFGGMVALTIGLALLAGILAGVFAA